MNLTQQITDTQAMNLIHEIMSSEQWRPHAWADIADVMTATGREIAQE